MENKGKSKLLVGADSISAKDTGQKWILPLPQPNSLYLSSTIFVAEFSL